MRYRSPVVPSTLPGLTVKVVIFDFDGTIADSFDTVLQITNRLAVEFGYPPVLPDDVKRLKNLSSREVLKQSNVAMVHLPFLLRRFRHELNQQIRQLKPIPGMREILAELKQRGHRLGIVTSNSQENVLAFLEGQGLGNLFDFVDSGLTLFGKGRLIQRVIRQQNLSPETVIYVGDETRDIEAARKTQIKVIAVGWGFNSTQILAEHQPDFLVHQPDELVKAVEH